MIRRTATKRPGGSTDERPRAPPAGALERALAEADRRRRRRRRLGFVGSLLGPGRRNRLGTLLREAVSTPCPPLGEGGGDQA